MAVRFEENVNMRLYSSMRTGGVARRACFPENKEELIEAVRTLKNENAPFVVLGKCSNVLFPDGDVPFVPILTQNLTRVALTEREDGAEVYAACGTNLTHLAFDMCKNGFAGLTFAYGIPGSIGGAVFMNAGAYGGEMKDVVTAVEAYDAVNDSIVTLDAADCAFGYRTSVFAHNGLVILGAYLRLARGDAPSLIAEAKELMQKRADKQPLDLPSCGSAFKRPEGHFAGKLIEDSGLKGYAVGDAAVSEKHAGFVVNKGNATSEDVKTLLNNVIQKVRSDSGVTLEPEIRIL